MRGNPIQRRGLGETHNLEIRQILWVIRRGQQARKGRARTRTIRNDEPSSHIHGKRLYETHTFPPSSSSSSCCLPSVFSSLAAFRPPDVLSASQSVQSAVPSGKKPYTWEMAKINIPNLFPNPICLLRWGRVRFWDGSKIVQFFLFLFITPYDFFHSFSPILLPLGRDDRKI